MFTLNRRQLLKHGTTAAGLSVAARAFAQTPRPGVRVLPIEFGSDKMVFCDWWFMEAGYGLPFTPAQRKETNDQPLFMPYGVRLRVGKPQLTEHPVIVPDIPSDGSMGGYSTLLKDGGKFRLWYEAYHPGASQDEDAKICYAESDDCFHWRKPSLGIFEFGGSKNNNLIYNHGHGATVFLDPSGKADERYKMVHLDAVPLQEVNGKQLNAFVFGAVSPDGIHWRRLKEPLIKHTSDTQSVAEFDPVSRKYVAYLRGWEPQSRAGFGGRRIVVRTESPEFGNFPAPTTVLELGPEDPIDADIYTNAFQHWPGAGRAYLMTPAIYHRATDHTDLHLAVSHDGLHWHFPQQEPFLASGEEDTESQGTAYAGHGTVALSDGRWAFPVSANPNTHNMPFRQTSRRRIPGGLSLAILREDGYMALEAETHGDCWTQPATFTGGRLLINQWGLLGSRVLVELANETGKPFPGYSLADCDGLVESHVGTPVSWKGRTDVSSLQGQLVRIHFVLNRVRLYSFQFV